MRKSYKILDGYAWITAAVLLAIIILSALCGCSTKKVVTEQIYVHDTLRVNTSDTVYITRHKTDSVIDIRTIYVCDTVIKDKGVVIVLNEAGDTIKEKSWDNTRQSTREDSSTNVRQASSDSLAVYKAKVDSILKALDQRRNEKKTVEKGVPLREKILAVLILACVIAGILKWMKY